MTGPFRRFNVTFLCTVLGLAALVAATNALVDPYGVWEIVRSEGFNRDKPESVRVDQLVKPVIVARRRPREVFLGSSRVAYGLDPRHPSVDEAYNAALLGGRLYPMRRMVEHVLLVSPEVERLYLALDFFAFREGLSLQSSFRDYRLVRARMHPRDVVGTLLTMDATRASIRTLVGNASGRAFEGFLADGRLSPDRMRHRIERIGGMVERFAESLPRYFGPTRYADFRLADAGIEELERALDLARQQGVEVVLFINPVHAVLLELIHALDLWDEYLLWRERLSRLSPYWDFSGFNEITSEPIRDQMSYFWDVSHYRKEVGDRMLGRMAGGPGEAFGVLVRPGDAARRARELEEEASRWRRERPEDRAWLLSQLPGR